jgi:hypothetical protein
MIYPFFLSNTYENSFIYYMINVKKGEVKLSK